jgi:hypothetical protein
MQDLSRIEAQRERGQLRRTGNQKARVQVHFRRTNEPKVQDIKRIDERKV